MILSALLHDQALGSCLVGQCYGISDLDFTHVVHIQHTSGSVSKRAAANVFLRRALISSL